MAQIKHLFIICGEPSGDLNAANLASAIKKINPSIKISGVGGPLLRQAGGETFCDIKDLAVMGLFDVLKKLPKFLELKKLILEKISQEKPDALVLVDFSGFNLRLAKDLNRKIPVFYYISPQVWASRTGRVEIIKKYIHKMIVIFKFEQEFYRKHGIEADFVGHPLLDIVKPTMAKEEFLERFRIPAGKTTIALLPGSRKQEIENILPVMLKTAALIQKEIKDALFVIAKVPAVEEETYKDICRRFKLNLEIVEGKTYDCLNIADFCLVCSGTATLETAIMQKPFVVVYKMGFLNYLLYRPQVRVPYIGMVNIVAGKKIIPEFIQFRASPRKIAARTLMIISRPPAIERIKIDLAKVKSSLGENGASSRAANIILNSL